MNETPKHRRRWFQFSLRTLLVFMLLASIPLSWVAVKLQRARRQRAAVEAIEELGGAVGYDPLAPDWQSELLGRDFFGHVAVIVFRDFKVTDAGVVVEGITVTDAGLEHLKELTQLTHLSLRHAEITDAGLEHLKGLSQLEDLDIQHTRVTDAGLKHLQGLKRLKWLHISGTRSPANALEN